MNDTDVTSAALAALHSVEVDPIAQRAQASKLTKQYPLFTTSILCAYIQGAASPLFMDAAPENYMQAVSDSKEQEFMAPLWLILHNNKNIKFRPINPQLIPDGKESEFARILHNFRHDTTLAAFLRNYKTFLNFLAANAITIDPAKIFTDLIGLLGRIGAYREDCITSQPSVESTRTIITGDDLSF